MSAPTENNKWRSASTTKKFDTFTAYMEICAGIITSLHAFKRMLERSISDTDVETVILYGEVIKHYPDDNPYPSKLIFKMINKTPVHVVIAKNEMGECVVYYGVYTRYRYLVTGF